MSTIISTYKFIDLNMKQVNYSYFRNNLANVLDKVNEDHTPVLITRQNAKPAIVISVEDYNSYQETIYLMSSRNNRNRLNKAIKDIEQLKVINKELIE